MPTRLSGVAAMPMPERQKAIIPLVTKLRLVTRELAKLRFAVAATKRSFVGPCVTKRSLVTSGNERKRGRNAVAFTNPFFTSVCQGHNRTTAPFELSRS